MPHLMPTLLLACSDYSVDPMDTTDTWTQPDTTIEVDVLFVIDDSGSMAEEQDRLAANFGAFVDALQATPNDWRIGVTTTDPEDGGALHGGVLSPGMTDLAAAFAAAVDVGTEGDRDEQGLYAATMAVQPDTNVGFLRPGASFHVVFVADEDDHSAGEVDSWLSRLQLVDAAMKAHALVGDEPEGCLGGTSAASAGTRYLEAAERTGGYADSICADDYASLLERVGLDAAGWNTTFELTQIPQPDTLVVTVDDVTIPGRAVDGWTYDAGLNALVFSGRAVPRPGMEILATYRRWIGPAAE